MKKVLFMVGGLTLICLVWTVLTIRLAIPIILAEYSGGLNIWIVLGYAVFTAAIIVIATIIVEKHS